MVNQYEQGLESEKYVKNIFEELGFEVYIDDTFYDLRIIKNNVQHLIEVKSTNLVIKNGGDVSRYGRFDFTDKRNRILQRKNNVHYCFVVRIGDCFEIIGFSSAKTMYAKRYISLNHIMTKRKLKTLNKFIKKW